jgi:GT2 family glycosyltransferase
VLSKSTFGSYAINIIWSGDSKDPTLTYLKNLGCCIFQYPNSDEFNYAKAFNFALRTSDTDDVIVLNDDLEVISPDWIESLLELSQQPRVGAVGAKLLFEDLSIQHAGIVTGVDGVCGHMFYKRPSNEIGYQNFTHLIRNYSCITGAVFATRLELMNQIGGMDENYKVEFNDVDVCMRLKQNGYDIVYTPYSKLFHYENSSFKRLAPNSDNRETFLKKWDSIIKIDPFYNVNLPKDLNSLK